MECVAKTKFRHYTTSKYYKGKHKFLRALLVHASAGLPAGVAAALFYCWWACPGCIWIAADRAGNCLEQIHEKLNEGDLWPWFLLLDICCFYSFAFVPAYGRSLPKPGTDFI